MLHNMPQWILFIGNVPGPHHTPRMRAWRALKTLGAAVLRDGVYLLPMRDECRTALHAIAADVRSAGGTAYVLTIEEPDGTNFTALFDRRDDYRLMLSKTAEAQAALSVDTALNALKQLRKLRRNFAELATIDFFPGDARVEVDGALAQLELTANRALGPDEPHAFEQVISRRRLADVVVVLEILVCTQEQRMVKVSAGH